MARHRSTRLQLRRGHSPRKVTTRKEMQTAKRTPPAKAHGLEQTARTSLVLSTAKLAPAVACCGDGPPDPSESLAIGFEDITSSLKHPRSPSSIESSVNIDERERARGGAYVADLSSTNVSANQLRARTCTRVKPSSTPAKTTKKRVTRRRRGSGAAHNKTLTFKCHHCNKLFSRKYNLQMHKRTHLNERSNTCALCGEGFTQKSNLKRHMQLKDVHNKVPSFKCPYCDEMFMRLFNQKVHIATHMNQRKHPCLLCGDEFTQKSNLKRHMQRKHEKPMKCPKCEARFAKPEECEVHFGVAHPGLKWSRFKIRVARSTAKKHQCYCKAKFTSKEDFANHRAQCSVADEFEKHRLMQKQEAVVGDNDDEMKEEAALSPVATSSPRRQVAVSGDASIAPSTSSHSPPSKRPQHSLPSLHSGHSLSSQHSGHSLPSLHSGHSLPPLHSGHPDSNAARHPDPSIDATASSQGSIGLGDLMKHHGAPSTAAAAGGVLAQQQHPPGVALPDPPAYTEEPVTDSSAVQNPLTFEDREALEFVKKVLPGMRMKAAMGQAPLLPSSIHGPLSGLDITSLQISSGSSPAAATDLPPAQFSPPAAIPLDLSFPPMSNTGNLATFPSSSASLALPSLPPLGATDLGDIGGNFAHSPTDLPPLVQRQASLSLSAGAGGVAGAASLPPSSMPFLAPQISSGALASDSLVDRSRPPLVLQHSGTFPAIGLMSLDSVDSMHDAFGSSAAVSAMTIAPSTKLTHSRNSSISLSIQSAHSDSAVAASINAASTSMLMEDATERMLLQGQALGPHDHPQEKGLVEEESAGDLYSF